MTTPAEAFQRDVARLVLDVACEHGFALAGGHALAAHDVIHRPTEDVDLFTATDGAVRRAAVAVEAALTDAGYTVEPVDDVDDLSDLIDGFAADIAEYEVSCGENMMRLQLARFDRRHEPVMMAIGPVLHLDDVLATKVAALATRAEPRDYIDVAAALDTRTREQLLELAAAADPAIGPDEYADAMVRLDRLADVVFRDVYRLDQVQIDALRARFADWPRPER
ncbi:nucleotidyl transferase AbiEii/AbiGii toxin family protein [Actinocatenispora rupis]|uniref:Nucleotidyl transferase AbiEii toxin, Type IV TA system n=1 Tax=Actinocatenispora rupis TaxID=519421 RepID=A0A8J3NEI5_9ACTN|nr:nucleotidyl transferase AbiEii/AbiGii toxin family protein [Actinocatenispora rupis]GID12614.1 hypothetical protein Aru02nite_35030 [Actinocatenispora rupis]